MMPAQLMLGNSDANTTEPGLPLVALRALAMQASIRELTHGARKPHRNTQEKPDLQ